MGYRENIEWYSRIICAAFVGRAVGKIADLKEQLKYASGLMPYERENARKSIANLEKFVKAESESWMPPSHVIAECDSLERQIEGHYRAMGAANLAHLQNAQRLAKVNGISSEWKPVVDSAEDAKRIAGLQKRLSELKEKWSVPGHTDDLFKLGLMDSSGKYMGRIKAGLAKVE